MSILAAVFGFPNNQTSLNPAGPAAAHIEHTFALIFWITGSVYFLTLAMLVYFVWRRRYTLNNLPQPQSTTTQGDRLARRAVAGAIALTVVLLFIMLVSSFITRPICAGAVAPDSATAASTSASRSASDMSAGR